MTTFVQDLKYDLIHFREALQENDYKLADLYKESIYVILENNEVTAEVFKVIPTKYLNQLIIRYIELLYERRNIQQIDKEVSGTI